jgi:hypothetical protein
MTKTPSDIPPNSAPAMATPRPPPPPQPGEKHGMTTCSRANPVPAIIARPPAPHGVNGAPFGVDDAPINSVGSVTLLSPGTIAGDGFLTPRGKSTPFHAAVPWEIITPRVTTRSAFRGLAGSNASDNNEPPPDPVVAAPAPAPSAFQMEGKSIADFGLEDAEIGPSTAPTATTLVPTYRDVQCMVTENLNSLSARVRGPTSNASTRTSTRTSPMQRRSVKILSPTTLPFLMGSTPN